MPWLAALLVPAPAPEAAPQTAPERAGYRLSWAAPPDCPAEQDVRAAIDRSLGGHPRDRSVDARVRVSALPGGEYHLELTLAGPDAGHRELTARDCRELADAAALIVAIAVDPALLERSEAPRVEPTPQGLVPQAPPPPPPEPDPATPEPAPPPTDPPGTAEPTTARGPAPEPPPPRADGRSRAAVSLRVAAGPGFAVLPGITAALEVAAGFGGRWWRAEAGLTYWTPRATATGDDPDVGGRFQLAAASGRGCVVPEAAPVRFPICAGLDAGVMIGRGVGADVDARTAVQPWVTVRAGPAIRWRMIPRLALWLGGDVLVPLARPRFHTSGTPDLWAVPGVAGAVVAGLDIPLR